MPLNRSLRNHLAREYEFVAKKIASDEEHPVRKMFYFSAVYGEATRILNLEWDANLALIHQTAKDSHQQISAGIQQVAGGNQSFIVDPLLFDGLAKCVEELTQNVKLPKWDDAALFITLRRMAVLAYSVLGNGQYLSIRGKLKIPDLNGPTVSPLPS